jgi:hypothetical protein
MGRSKFARFQILETLSAFSIAKFSLPLTEKRLLSDLYNEDNKKGPAFNTTILKMPFCLEFIGRNSSEYGENVICSKTND